MVSQWDVLKINPFIMQESKQIGLATRWNKAFTLAEMMIAIFLLSILIVMSFQYLQWSNQRARDSVRVSDLEIIKSYLEARKTKTTVYEQPANWINVTYSAWIVWTQWTFWEESMKSMEGMKSLPKDPLTWNVYSYSVTQNAKDYELWAITEARSQDSASKDTSSTLEELAYTIWSFNGVLAKSISWSSCKILAIPTILSNDTISNDLTQINADKSLVYDGYSNLPSTYSSSDLNVKGGFNFSSNNLLAYSDDKGCSPLFYKNDYSHRVNLIHWVEMAYSWTLLQTNPKIQAIIKKSTDKSISERDLSIYSNDFVEKFVWWKISDFNNH